MTSKYSWEEKYIGSRCKKNNLHDWDLNTAFARQAKENSTNNH